LALNAPFPEPNMDRNSHRPKNQRPSEVCVKYPMDRTGEVDERGLALN
jgi:hypothetical protein